MTRLHAIAMMATTIAVVGCQYNPFAHRFLKREPSVDEVVGNYILREVYVDMVAEGLSEKIRSRTPKPLITLRSDGTAILQSFPVFKETEEGFDYEFEGFEDIETRWEITPVGGVSSGGDAATVYGLTFDLADRECVECVFRWPTFTGNKTVDGMIFTLYDGDQGQILGFTKSTDPSVRQ